MTTIPTGYWRLLLRATLAAAAVFLLVATRAVAQEPTVHVEVPATEVAANGEPFTLTVVVEDVTNLGAFQFDLTYDPSVLTLVDVQEGPFLGSSGREVTCLPPRMAEGSLGLSCVTLGATPDGPNGAGELATLLFQAVAAGTSPLQFERLILTDPPAERMNAGREHGCLTLEPAVESTYAATLWTPPTDAADGDEELCLQRASESGFAWIIWGPVIGIAVLALAAAMISAAWWLRRSRRA